MKGKNQCKLCRKDIAPGQEYCKECFEKEKQIGRENVELNLLTKKMILKAKERELEYRIVRQIDNWEQKKEVNFDDFEPDIIISPNGSPVKLGERLPLWKLINMREKWEFDIEMLKREIEDIKQHLKESK